MVADDVGEELFDGGVHVAAEFGDVDAVIFYRFLEGEKIFGFHAPGGEGLVGGPGFERIIEKGKWIRFIWFIIF